MDNSVYDSAIANTSLAYPLLCIKKQPGQKITIFRPALKISNRNPIYSWKFPTGNIVDAQNINFAREIPKMGVIQLQILHFWMKIFLTKHTNNFPTAKILEDCSSLLPHQI